MSPRVLILATSVMWRHVTADPLRSLLLGWRVLPRRLRPWLRCAGPYGRATVVWGSGDRAAALSLLGTSPRRLATFALAVDRPGVARSALDRMPAAEPARPVLLARLAVREGRLRDGVAALDGVPGRKAARLRAAAAGELHVLTDGIPPGARPARPAAPGRSAASVPGRVLHLVTDALPTTNAGYTVRTQRIAMAQREAGLDPHVVTKAGFPVAQGHPDGRRVACVDGVPYHRLLPYRLPYRADAAAALGHDLAARLTGRLRPAVLHAASNHLNGQLALALREDFGLPVIYEVRGFWEETWLSRHGVDPGPGARPVATMTPSRPVTSPADAARPARETPARETVVPARLLAADLTASDFYLLSREAETRCMTGADLVVTLGEVMRAEIVARGVDPGKVIVVPNAVSAEFLEPLPDGGPLREALGIRPDELVVGLVSNLVAYEGVGTLLEAAAELRRRGQPVRPLIVGDGADRAALQRLAGKLGLTGIAIFTGRVPMAEVRRYHAVLDLFVVPRTTDRVCQLVTPLKPVEAMASGLTVVASDVGALREIIRPEATGALATSGDPASFADIMEPLLYSSDTRRKLGANAREWVARDRTWAHNAAIYRAAYERLGAV
ncbi:MAG: glycosyltransferase family 4 protein [Streptosporangiaceae bacterium]